MLIQLCFFPIDELSYPSKCGALGCSGHLHWHTEKPAKVFYKKFVGWRDTSQPSPRMPLSGRLQQSPRKYLFKLLLALKTTFSRNNPLSSMLRPQGSVYASESRDAHAV